MCCNKAYISKFGVRSLCYNTGILFLVLPTVVSWSVLSDPSRIPSPLHKGFLLFPLTRCLLSIYLFLPGIPCICHTQFETSFYSSSLLYLTHPCLFLFFNPFCSRLYLFIFLLFIENLSIYSYSLSFLGDALKAYQSAPFLLEMPTSLYSSLTYRV